MKALVLSTFSLLLLAGCVHVFSDQTERFVL
jgi:hypothetical protein